MPLDMFSKKPLMIDPDEPYNRGVDSSVRVMEAAVRACKAGVIIGDPNDAFVKDVEAFLRVMDRLDIIGNLNNLKM